MSPIKLILSNKYIASETFDKNFEDLKSGLIVSRDSDDVWKLVEILDDQMVFEKTGILGL
jgi:hypothetical protein